jgi:hypothetical protein
MARIGSGEVNGGKTGTESAGSIKIDRFLAKEITQRFLTSSFVNWL